MLVTDSSPRRNHGDLTAFGLRHKLNNTGNVVGYSAIFPKVVLIADSSLFLPLDNISIVLGIKKQDAVLRTNKAFGGPSGDGVCNAFVPFSNGNVYWDFAGSVEGSTRLSVAGLTTTGYHNWAFTTGPAGMKIFQDGLLRASNAGTPTRTLSNDSFGLGYDSVGTTSDTIDYSYFYVYDRQLTSNEIASLSTDPYQMFEPEPIWLFGGQGAAVGGAVAPTSIFYGPFVGPFGGPI